MKASIDSIMSALDLRSTSPETDLWSNPEDPEGAMEVALSQIDEAPGKPSRLGPERKRL